MTDGNAFEAIVAGLDTDVDIAEAVLHADAQWFADHPRQRIRLRPLLLGEYGDEVGDREAKEHGPFLVVVVRGKVRMLVRPLHFDVLGEEADSDD